VAGALVGLLALHAVKPDADLLAQAIYCAEHLLNLRVTAGDGHTWRNADGLVANGLADGSAGVVLALLKLYTVNPDPRWLAAAQSALIYERALSTSQARHASGAQHRQSLLDRGWRYGATGIGLARLAMLPVFGGQAVRAEIDTAVEAVLHEGAGSLHHCAAGAFGEIDLLFEAGRRLNRRDLLDAAYMACGRVLVGVEKAGSFHLSSELPRELFHPSFFRGEAGIGYTLLRLAQYRTEGKTTLPCVLSWEIQRVNEE